ncbi:MAG: hypothetical protein ABH840_04060 [Nanoarchaeota archaeon]
MASITFAVDEELKNKLSKFVWINLSVLAMHELLREFKRQKVLKKLEEFSKGSDLTDEEALKLGRKIKEGIWKKYKEKGW